MRINKYLALCGLASRRKVEDLIRAGEIYLNGEVCETLGYRVQKDDVISYLGKTIKPLKRIAIAYYKPVGLICSREDEQGRPTIYRDLPANLQHLNYAGRLDKMSEGLVILCNDGELIHKLGKPEFAVEKEYFVEFNRKLAPTARAAFLRGVRIPTGKASAKSVSPPKQNWTRIILTQGLKNQIREMAKALDYEVKTLIRARIGKVRLESLRPTKFRKLDTSKIF